MFIDVFITWKFDKEESKEIKESTTNPESGYYVKDERTKQFAYFFHVASDRNGFVLGTIVTPGNTHESHIFEPLVEQVIGKVGNPKRLRLMQPIKHLPLKSI